MMLPFAVVLPVSGHESDRAGADACGLEGVSFAFRDSLEALAQAGTRLSGLPRLAADRSLIYWLKCLRRCSACPVDIPEGGEFGAAFGAARLGLIAAENADPLRRVHAAGDGKKHHPNREHAEGL
jgi:xylulokinase